MSPSAPLHRLSSRRRRPYLIDCSSCKPLKPLTFCPVSHPLRRAAGERTWNTLGTGLWHCSKAVLWASSIGFEHRTTIDA